MHFKVPELFTVEKGETCSPFSRSGGQLSATFLRKAVPEGISLKQMISRHGCLTLVVPRVLEAITWPTWLSPSCPLKQ